MDTSAPVTCLIRTAAAGPSPAAPPIPVSRSRQMFSGSPVSGMGSKVDIHDGIAADHVLIVTDGFEGAAAPVAARLALAPPPPPPPLLLL